MPYRIQKLTGCVVGLACMAWSPAALAEDEGVIESAPPTFAASRAANPFGVTKALDDVALARERGGTDVFNDMKLKGVVADNQAINLSTGNNLISDGALAGAAGLPMVIQNSGNNVLIQNATIVNVQLK
jgi:hypothetical protein